MKTHIPAFLMGSVVGSLTIYAVLNGGACRPSPTPTDEGKPIPVSVDVPVKPVADAPAVAPVTVAPEVVAPMTLPAEVKSEAPVNAPT